MTKEDILCKNCCYYDKRDPPKFDATDDSRYPSVIELDWCGEFEVGAMKENILL